MKNQVFWAIYLRSYSWFIRKQNINPDLNPWLPFPKSLDKMKKIIIAQSDHNFIQTFPLTI